MLHLTRLLGYLLVLTVAVAAPSTSRVQSEQDIGALPESVADWQRGSHAHPDLPYTITITFDGKDMDGLSQRMNDIALSGTKRWLTQGELKEYTSPEESHKEAVIAYFKQHGILEEAIVEHQLGDQLLIHTDVKTVNRVFSTQLAHFHHHDTEESAVRSPGYILPTELHGKSILSISPLTHFASQQQRRRRKLPRGQVPVPLHDLGKYSGPPSCASYLSGTTPNCWRDLYGLADVKPKPSSDRVDIGIIGYGNSSFDQADVTRYLTRFRPALTDYKVGLHLMPDYKMSPEMVDEEATMDVSTASVLAAPLKVVFFGLKFMSDIAFESSLRYIASLPSSQRPGVLSSSYGLQEKDYGVADIMATCKAAAMLTALGTTIVAASGDSGVAGISFFAKCSHQDKQLGPTFPGTCSHILSVGATDGSGSSSFLPETMTDGDANSTATAQLYSGAGVSNHIPLPAWQSNSVKGYVEYLKRTSNPVLKYIDVNPVHRSIPDMVTYGATFLFHYKGRWEPSTGGTSLSAPLASAIIALVNAERRAKGKGNVGWVHPVIYSEKAKSMRAFVDVKHGQVYGCANLPKTGFRAVPGFDFASGLGRPSFPQLSSLFSS